MRKKIIFLIFILSSCCFLFGCFFSSDVLYLYLENTENITVIQGEEYEPKGVKVYAINSNEEKEDVTEQAKFASIDTSTLGDKIVRVTYKKEKAAYKVTVIEPKLILDVNHTKMVYFIGEKFSKEDVLLYDKDGKKEIKAYDISIKDSQGNSFDEDNPFISIGAYKVRLSNGKLYAEYSIMVSRSTEEGRVDELENISSFANLRPIYENSLGKISMSGSKTILENEGVAETFKNHVYSARILMKKEDSKILLDIKEKCGALFLFAGEDASISLNKKCDIYGNIQSDLSYTYVELNLGSYEMDCSNDVYLYAVSLVSIEHTISSNMYVELSIDTKNVQTSYSIGERVDLSGILIYAVKEDGTKVPLTVSQCYVSIIKNNQEVNSLLSESGTYKVMISYLEENIFATYSIQVLESSNISFQTIELDTLNTKTIFVGENFNASGLKVYGTNGNEKKEIPSSNYSIQLKNASKNVVSNFTTNGSYTVVVRYTGPSSSPNNVAEYVVEYYRNNAEKVYTHITVDTGNALCEYNINDSFTTSGIIVSAHYANGASEELVREDYNIELTLNNAVVTSLAESGTYVANVTYTGLSTIGNARSNYEVQVSAVFVTVSFAYSGPSVGYVQWEEQISLNADPKDYIRVPDSSYAFMGFSVDLTRLDVNESYFVKVYVDKPASNKKRITYLNYNAVYQETAPIYRDIDLNASVPTEITPAVSAPEGYEFYTYDIPSGAIVTENVYYFPLYKYQNEEEAVSIIRIHSTPSTSRISSLLNAFQVTLQSIHFIEKRDMDYEIMSCKKQFLYPVDTSRFSFSTRRNIMENV